MSETVAASKFQVLATPVKGQSDKKTYRVIRLENGLTACLISDTGGEIYNDTDDKADSSSSEEESGSEESFSETESEEDGVTEEEDETGDDKSRGKKHSLPEQKMAAAALCVGVGNFSDPKDVPGMSHFLEHMVFMGSEKFPEENDFDSFIKKRGGSDNASTDCEQTTFYFECLEKHFYKALDKFAQFFISPLMKRDSMTREREAIDSEFQMALPSDTYRKEQLLASLSKADCPVNSFAWGNLITLKENIDDNTLYKGVHEYRKRHYSAHRMTVAVQARLPMQTLETYVVDCFSKVPNNNLPPDDFGKLTNSVFDTPEFKKIYYVKPVKDLCQLDLTWVLPSMKSLYRSKPEQYISWLLGDEGKGSLLSYLKEKVWALAIYSGNGESGFEYNSMYALFTLNIVLTEEGMTHLKEVIEVVFSYISMLKKLGPQEAIFKEIQLVEETAFKYGDEEPASDVVEDLVENMQLYPPEDYLTGSELYFQYNPEAITEVVNVLRPDNVNIMVISNKLPDNLKYDKIEPWFQTQYLSLDVPSDWMDAWNKAQPRPELALPPPNQFLTTDFSLLPKTGNCPKYPQKVHETPLLELWYKKDEKFELPIAYYYYYLISPASMESPAGSCMMDMFVNLVTLQLSEEAYPAQFAELSYSVTHGEKGLLIKVSGYNEKLPILLLLIVKYFNDFDKNLTPKMFEAVKDKLAKNYHNRFIKPSALAKDLRLNFLVNNYWTALEKYATVDKITYEMLICFAKNFAKNLHIKGLVQGNVTEELAIETTKKLVESLNCKPLLNNTYPKVRVVQLPKGEHCCKVMSFNKNDSNCIVTNYYQSGAFSVKTSVIIELIMMLIEEPLFDVLRTKEQLGYHVFCTVRDTHGILGYTITVNAQAVKNTTQHVDRRIEAFVEYSNKLLKKVTERNFAHAKDDLIKVKRCADVHLEDEVDRNWAEITNDDYFFDRLEQEIVAIQQINAADVRNWWETHNMFGGRDNFRKLSLQVVGYKPADNNKEKPPKENGDKNEKSGPTSPLCCETENEKDGQRDQHYSYDMAECEADLVKEKGEDYFIRDIEAFKKDLFLYPVVVQSASK